MEIGVYSFVEIGADPVNGARVDPVQRMRDLMEEVELADRVGLDVFGIGEHHRAEYAASSPAVVLAAAAERSTRIRLTSAVTVLSSDDPVRVFQDFATVDLLSAGRAEIMAGRGSFIESFPLFGLNLNDYDDLFAEKLELLLRLRDHEGIAWSGDFRPALTGQGVYPRPVQQPLPVWVAVGGNPASAVRAGRLGLPLALAIIGGSPERFVPFVTTYRNAARKAGHDPDSLDVSINSPGFLADTSESAVEAFYPSWFAAMTRIGRERGWSPMTREQFDVLRSPGGALLLGSPDEVVEKLLFEHALFGNTRFCIQLTLGTIPHEKVLRAIEILGTTVAPVVREEVARRRARGAGTAHDGAAPV